jgi:hypothetical protein
MTEPEFDLAAMRPIGKRLLATIMSLRDDRAAWDLEILRSLTDAQGDIQLAAGLWLDPNRPTGSFE